MSELKLPEIPVYVEGAAKRRWKKDDEEDKGKGKSKASRDPGAVDPKLRKKMGDEIADLFDSVGTKAYQAIIASAADKIASDLADHAKELRNLIKEQHGRNGLKQASEYIHDWATSLAHDLMQYAPDEISDKVEAAIRGSFTELENPEPAAEAAPAVEPAEPVSEEPVEEEKPAKKEASMEPVEAKKVAEAQPEKKVVALDPKDAEMVSNLAKLAQVMLLRGEKGLALQAAKLAKSIKG
jgi:hypothetical protein